ncbi:MAG: HPr kinase/phosphatase C-terminal domain-containing protein [Proteobacteria bacterium]|nr:HPr kinase/phosphatase C-terminal domain-containing protein [Pseudomonadota bacterium]
MTLYHATCIEIDSRGILIEGPSGSGKSDLALRLMSRGAKLVSDDYVELASKGGHLTATAPEKIAGKMEVRGVGLVDVDYTNEVRIALLIELTPRDEIPRLPDPRHKELGGVRVPHFALEAFDSSAVDKIFVILKSISQD